MNFINLIKLKKVSLLLIFMSIYISLIAQEIPLEFQIKRKEVFEFTKAPTIKIDSKNIVIEFEAKDFCDATVVIEDEQGNIVRHLVSGVLGKNAPEPFQKDSLSQKLTWDKKMILVSTLMP